MEKNIGIIAAARKWKQGYRGAGVTVAVVDSGVNPHPELDGRVTRKTCLSPVWVDPSKDAGFDETGIGHGTHVAGIIAGKTCGVAPDARILSLKVFSGMNECSARDVADAIHAAVDYGVDVINLSLGFGSSGDGVMLMIEGAIKRAVQSDIIVIGAAGNTGDERLWYPAAYDDVVSVGAVDLEKRVAMFSTRNGAVDLSAPGVDILSAGLDGKMVRMSGTSMAAPHVAGIAALLAGEYKARFGERMPEKELYRALMMNSVDIGVAGRDNETGVGFATLGMGREVRFRPGEKTRWVDGVPQPIDAAPSLVPPGRTFGPFTHLAEPFGMVGAWKDGTAFYWG
jgi:major intracellular serine protease